jgi:hypothetical protein
VKLTDSQKRYLENAPFSYTSWGGKPLVSPFKGFRPDLAYDLVRAGLLKSSMPGPFETIFTLTNAGRSAILK